MRKCISITDDRVIRKLEKVGKGNQSEYLQNLVLQDIKNPNYNPAEFIDIIKDLLNNSSTNCHQSMDEEAMLSILELENENL